MGLTAGVRFEDNEHLPTLLGIGEMIQRRKRIIDSRYAARSVQVVLPRKEQRSDTRRLPGYRDRSSAYISAKA